MSDQAVLDREHGRVAVLLERIARLAESGCRCRRCGRVVEGGVVPLVCGGRCSLEGLTNRDIANAVRALALEEFQRG